MLFNKVLVFTDTDKRALRKAAAEHITQMVDDKDSAVKAKDIIGALKSAGPTFQYLLEKYTESQIATHVRERIRSLRGQLERKPPRKKKATK